MFCLHLLLPPHTEYVQLASTGVLPHTTLKKANIRFAEALGSLRSFTRHIYENPFTRHISENPFTRHISENPFTRHICENPFTRHICENPFTRLISKNLFTRRVSENPFHFMNTSCEGSQRLPMRTDA